MLESPLLLKPNDTLIESLAKRSMFDESIRLPFRGVSIIPTYEEEFNYWKGFVNHPDDDLVFAFDGKVNIGIAALDRISKQDRNARLHFAFWNKSVNMMTIRQMYFQYCMLDLGLERLYGMTPASNKIAINSALKTGFSEVGRLPNHFKTLDGYEDAVITHIELKEAI